MPITAPNQPSVDINLPVPQPAPMTKRPKQPAPQAAPQPQQQPVAQPLQPIEPPGPVALVLPWNPEPKRQQFKRLKIRYASEGDAGGWLDPSGVMHSLGGINNHGTWALKNGLGTIDDAMKKGWMRVYYVSGDLVAHNGFVAPNDHQKATLIDKAMEHGLSRVTHDYDEDERTLWSEHDKLSRKVRYADDDLDFSMEAMRPEGTISANPHASAPTDEAQGRKRRQTLLQILEAAKKGHYDPAGMTPREIIKDMEDKEPKSEEMQNILYDPETDEEQPPLNKMQRYAKLVQPTGPQYTPEQIDHALENVQKNVPTDPTYRHIAAGMLEANGRHGEAGILRDMEHPPFVGGVMSKYRGKGLTVDPGQYTGTALANSRGRVDEYLNEMSDHFHNEAPIDVLRQFEADQYRPEDFQEPSEYAKPIPPHHARVVHWDESASYPHHHEDVPWSEVGRHLADWIEDDIRPYDESYEGLEDANNEAEYNRLLDELRNAPYVTRDLNRTERPA